MHIIKWAVLLSIFWLLLSGFIQPLLLSFGAISVALVLLVLHRMDRVDNEQTSPATNFKLLRYSLWLVKEIALSSIHVTKLIWGRTENVSPALAKIPTNDVSAHQQVLYANSITLTPGTLSVDLDEKEITVHALQASSIDELKEGGMESKILSIWGNKKWPVCLQQPVWQFWW